MLSELGFWFFFLQLEPASFKIPKTIFIIRAIDRVANRFAFRNGRHTARGVWLCSGRRRQTPNNVCLQRNLQIQSHPTPNIHPVLVANRRSQDIWICNAEGQTLGHLFYPVRSTRGFAAFQKFAILWAWGDGDVKIKIGCNAHRLRPAHQPTALANVGLEFELLRGGGGGLICVLLGLSLAPSCCSSGKGF